MERTQGTGVTSESVITFYDHFCNLIFETIFAFILYPHCCNSRLYYVSLPLSTVLLRFTSCYPWFYYVSPLTISVSITFHLLFQTFITFHLFFNLVLLFTFSYPRLHYFSPFLLFFSSFPFLHLSLIFSSPSSNS